MSSISITAQARLIKMFVTCAVLLCRTTNFTYQVTKRLQLLGNSLPDPTPRCTNLKYATVRRYSVSEKLTHWNVSFRR